MELTPIKIMLKQPNTDVNVYPVPCLVYIKDEADKVIADLEESHKMEAEQLLILNREQANAANRLRDSMERVIRHNKYKRCLAMARWCKDKVDAIKNGYIVSSIESQHGDYSRWQKRWLKIAERFKEAK